jgi:hypothetical protein
MIPADSDAGIIDLSIDGAFFERFCPFRTRFRSVRLELGGVVLKNVISDRITKIDKTPKLTIRRRRAQGRKTRINFIFYL